MEHRVWTVYCSFLERSVGNVRHFFWLLFRMTWARILLLFECFEGAPPWDFFVLWACRNRFAEGTGTNPMFRAASVLFRMTWARILLLFECFEGLAWGDFFSLFLVGSKSNVSAVFWLRFRMVWALYFFLFSGFQKRRFGIFPAAVSQWLGHKTCWGSAFSHAFLVGSKSDVSAFFRLRFRNGLGTKPAAWMLWVLLPC